MLCLLDIARIAYVKYGFTEAPGLVKFEQEIDREIAIENELLNGSGSLHEFTDICVRRDEDKMRFNNTSSNRNSHGRARNSIDIAFDKTDELVMRYCRHKEEEAARKKIESLEEAAKLSCSEQRLFLSTNLEPHQYLNNSIDGLCDKYLDNMQVQNSKNEHTSKCQEFVAPTSTCDIPKATSKIQSTDLEHELEVYDDLSTAISSSICDNKQARDKKSLVDLGNVDSLDSGEGPTESASTGLSSSQVHDDTFNTQMTHTTSIPVAKKRTSLVPSVSSQQASSMTNSELSSSRSSLLSNQDGSNSVCNNQYGRQITSDLDGKVMRIAKSYYGKKATKDVTRLSEGKYKIADRIVFVRLLKGHRVMVRIGGGWDTLENFLFRHKSDPSQVIDPDNLLPIETKMPFDKTAQITPIKSSRLPYYRRSESASSTNLSLSNLSLSNHSLISSTTPSHKSSERTLCNSLNSSSIARFGPNQSPYLFIHKVQAPNNESIKISSPLRTIESRKRYSQLRSKSQDRQSQASQFGSPLNQPKLPSYHQQRATINHPNNHLVQHPLVSSKTPAVSASNLFPATLTTPRLKASNHQQSQTRLPIYQQKKAFSTSKTETIRKFGFSSDSLHSTTFPHKLPTQNHFTRGFVVKTKK